jgi:AAA+ ATPase superfamily predicted ATPase
MKKKENPFYFGNEVYNEDFCNRKEELKELQNDINNGINVLLYAPRRFGKTSLLKKLQNNLKHNKKYLFIYFDFFSVSSIDEFIQKYFDTIIKSIETTPQKIAKLFKTTLNFRPIVSMSLNSIGDVSYNLSIIKKEQNNTLEDVLNLPFDYAKKLKKKVIVVFDEFQEIEQFSIEKKIRSIIQTHSRNVSYLFSGSKKTILTQMFNDDQRAFYKSVKHLHIEQIILDDWIEFIQNKFKITNKNIDTKYIKSAFEITNGFPYYMQQLMYVVWENTTKNVNEKIITDSLKTMLQRESNLYELIWTNLTPNQKKTLKYILKNDGKNLYSNDNLSDFNLSATTLKSTIEALIKKDVCDKRSNKYYFIDPFMKYWLQNM